MLTVQFVGLILAWVAYSMWNRRSLSKTTFAAMQLLSETRQVNGDISKAKEIAQHLPLIDTVPDEWYCVAGDPEARGGSVYNARDCVARFSEDESTYGIYVPPQPNIKKLSLQQILSKRPSKNHLEESVVLRANYMDHTRNCVRVGEKDVGTGPFQGVYDWCFRDYVSHEELFGMLATRMCVERIIFLPIKIGQLTVDGNTGMCALDERSLLFGFIPLEMHWRGNVNKEQGAIVWDRTFLDIGWKGTVLSKSFDRPSMSERLRQNRWFIRYPKGQEKEGKLVFLYREGRGTLIYSRNG